MALAAKGTRIVTVDGRRYRWRVHTARDPNLAIVAELAEEPAGRLVAWVHPPTTIITAAVVRRAVRHALDHGWRPDRPGPEKIVRID